MPSPTFTLVQVYEIGEVPIWHFDAYRLRDPEEAWELGIEDAFRDGISLIEWPERLGPLLPAATASRSRCPTPARRTPAVLLSTPVAAGPTGSPASAAER